MKLFRNIGILGSLVLVGLTGCSGAAQEASNNDVPVAQQVALVTATNPAYVGAVLQGSYQYADTNNDSESGTQKAWLRDGQPIEGANQDTYTAIAQDSGKSLQYRVTPAAATGQSPGAAAVSAGITIENSAPVVTLSALVDPASSSATSVGSALSVAFSYSDVDGDAAATAEIRWLQGANSTVIATGPTYTVASTDLGSFLVAEVTPLALQGVLRGTAVRSPPVFIMNFVPVAQNVELKATTPVIIGTTLTASYTYFDADNDPEAGSSIQWLRNGVALGITTPTYTLTAPADVGASFRFTVTPISSPGTSPGISVTSNTLTAVNSAPRAIDLVVNGGITSTVVGTTLTANYAYSDLDLDPQGASTYRWYRDTSPTPIATTSNYTVVAVDSGANLAFEVTPVAAQGASPGMAVRSAVIRVNNSAPVAQNVTLSASDAIPPAKSVLTASYTYFDADGDAEGASTFRWWRGLTEITGATGLSYTLVDADSGATIIFEVTPIAAAGDARGSATRSNSIAVANSAPTVANVIIAPGTARVGTSLTATYTYADADGDAAAGSHLYEWRNGGTSVIGTAKTYIVAATDAHKTLTVKVTPVALTGTSPGAAVTSPDITIGNSPPSVTNLAIGSSVSGPVYTGVVLTASYSFKDPDGDGEGASTYQWQRGSADIGGATALAYTVTGADIDKELTVKVTPKDNLALAGTQVVSSAITPVNLAPVASNVVVIGVAVGQALNVNYTYFDHEADAEPAAGSRFRWLRNGLAITGATGRKYTLALADAGKTIGAEVTPLAQTGTLVGLPVTSSVAIATANVALTVSAGLKQLRFSWAAVPGASLYKMSYSPAEGAGFVPVSTTSSNITTTTYDWDISVHRINWPKAQFLLEACDASNFCLPSASISALSVMVGAIGYFKASNTGAGDVFGYSVALSADGNTLAVGAYGDDSSANYDPRYAGSTGGNPIDDCGVTTPLNCALDSGAVYIYTRTGATWTQQDYVKASNSAIGNFAGAGDNFGHSVALSADGNTLAVGAYGEDSSSTGIGSTPNESAPDAGAVYVYTRSGITWKMQAYVKASNTGVIDFFGYALVLSADGNTLAAGAYGEDSAATVKNTTPGQSDNSAAGSGAVYVYTRANGNWSPQLTDITYIKASNTGAYDSFGYALALSADGNTLAVGALGENSAATGVGGTQTYSCTTPVTNCAAYSGAVYVYTRTNGNWFPEPAYVKASNTGADDRFGFALALSADGNTLAVGAYLEDSAATGVGGNQTDVCPATNCTNASGAVYVYTRANGNWSPQLTDITYIKASNTGVIDFFGSALALSADGNTLAVGAYQESGAAMGVRGTQANGCPATNCAYSSGAVYVYTRANGNWSPQLTYIKASNTGAQDYFGSALALSADGNTLAVGASAEDSVATSVNNTVPGQSDNSAGAAGAVYLY